MVLSNAAFDDRLEEGIVRVGGMRAIIAAMKKHPKNKNLISSAIRALINLTFLEANAVLFVTKTDGVSLVLKCMKKFAGDDKIVCESCHLLLGLCKHEQLWNEASTSFAQTTHHAHFQVSTRTLLHAMACLLTLDTVCLLRKQRQPR